ncbi:transmembrane protein 265 isoform X2 [Latimeria chalumnae]|nr:PREDICTED: transmembrane protein 265 isoform X2 [Latimeria chalumnae]XP_014346830.1 PREDICTED: transmembrane protein 265 isoform X2 [Latimeria chalumnae]XP_014346831.1 PREDICTED: transmembrane protein 265 isoform X2 [Latimeria chalumnae]|eukprot:XP_014346829.1 PREDICTED: transmembrane protein 265 isoform X2 [Latimeria chalumnae]
MAAPPNYINGSAHVHSAGIEENRPLTITTPQPLFIQVQQEKPYQSYLYWAICSTLCGCSCLGIASLIFAVRAQERHSYDHEKAEYYARKSRRFCITSTVVLAAIVVLILVLLGLVPYLKAVLE